MISYTPTSQMYSNGWSLDYKISVIIPTRQRSQLLINCLNSLLDKSYKEDRLFEIILLVDNDDSETLQTAIELQSKFNFINQFDSTLCNSLTIMIVCRSEYMQRDYNNAGSVAAKGELVLVLNDDVIMNTENWDHIIYQFYKNNKTKDDVMMIAIYDNTHDSESKDCNGEIRASDTHGPCFPIVTKTFINHMKGIFPSNIRMWGADIILFKIFQNIGRVYSLKNVSVNHSSFHTSTRTRDNINDHVSNISSKEQYLPPLSEYINYIKLIISKTTALGTVIND